MKAPIVRPKEEFMILLERRAEVMTATWLTSKPPEALELDGIDLETWWTEFLCLRRTIRGPLELSLRRHERLGETIDYWDGGDELTLPDTIDGKLVVGGEHCSVVGGGLECMDSTQLIEFEQWPDQRLVEWLEARELDVGGVGALVGSAVTRS